MKKHQRWGGKGENAGCIDRASIITWPIIGQQKQADGDCWKKSRQMERGLHAGSMKDLRSFEGFKGVNCESQFEHPGCMHQAGWEARTEAGAGVWRLVRSVNTCCRAPAAAERLSLRSQAFIRALTALPHDRRKFSSSCESVSQRLPESRNERSQHLTSVLQRRCCQLDLLLPSLIPAHGNSSTQRVSTCTDALVYTRTDALHYVLCKASNANTRRTGPTPDAPALECVCSPCHLSSSCCSGVHSSPLHARPSARPPPARTLAT